jgi:hypothetical protein
MSRAQSKQDSAATRNYTKAEQEVINLSKKKWLWMSDKKIDSLNTLFDDKSMFSAWRNLGGNQGDRGH